MRLPQTLYNIFRQCADIKHINRLFAKTIFVSDGCQELLLRAQGRQLSRQLVT